MQQKDPALIAMESYPTPLHALRRIEMHHLLAFNEVQHDPGATKDDMLPMAIRLQESGEMKVPDPKWRPEPPKEEKSTLVEKFTDKALSVDDIKGMVSREEFKSHIELRKAVKHLPGLDWKSTQSMKRKEILDKLNG